MKITTRCPRCGVVKEIDERVWYHRCSNCGEGSNIFEEWWNSNHVESFSELTDEEKLEAFKNFRKREGVNIA
jgi:hypothetical protein